METRVCSTCETEKPIDAFVKDNRKPSGRGARCQECHRAACAAYVERNPARRLDSARRYYADHREEHGVRTARWAKAHPEVVREIRSRQRSRRREQIRAYRKAHGTAATRRSRAAHPNEYRARNKVNNAIARGVLPKAAATRCVRCGAHAAQYHHHKGYEPDRWLDVVPVCLPCHSVLR